jgi:hypothetical protein
MREDFAREGVVRYDVAYMATAVTATRSSILQVEAQQARHSVIALEAHGEGVDLACHRDIICL